MDCCEERGFLDSFDSCNVCEEQESNCGGNKGGACKGLKMVKEGADDVSLGLKEIEKAKKEVDKAICEVEKALKELKSCKRDLERAGCYEKEGLNDIHKGLHLIEEDLRKPRCFEPICR